MVCKEIVYKNDYANCISNDTGILTVSSAQPNQQRNANDTFASGQIFEIEFDYEQAIKENIEKFDEHSCAFIASTIESKLIQTTGRYHKKYCAQCITAFDEDEKVNDDFLILKSQTGQIRMPCISTLNIIKITNKICDLLSEHPTMHYSDMYGSVLKTVVVNLDSEKLFTNSNFDIHSKKTSGLLSHKEEFICKIVDEYMTLKSQRIGARISEEKRGKYIRHNNKKRVHEAGQ